jgi:hypothetical protein
MSDESVSSLFKPRKVIQIAFVTADLDREIQRYASNYGMAPWYVYEISSRTVEDLYKYDGRREFAYRAAMCHIRDFEWELVEPLDEKSIYAEHLRISGPSLHHMAFEVDDYAAALEALKRMGKTVLQSGNWSGKRFAHIDTVDDLGFVTELFDYTAELREPEPLYVFPPHQ